MANYGFMKNTSLLLILVILSCCNKTSTTHLYVSQNCKDVALFNKGSYWLYSSDKTSQIDCTFIKSDPSFFSRTEETTIYEQIIVPYDGDFFREEYLSGSMDGVLLMLQ
jgi:hypothetical protein